MAENLKLVLRNNNFWAKALKKENLLPKNWPSSDWIYKEPYGAVLVYCAWNYPFQIWLLPLMIAALPRETTVVDKPSEVYTL